MRRGLIVIALLYGCSHGPSPADQAALTRLAVTIDTAHAKGCLDDAATSAAEADLTQLGVSLAEVDKARAMKEVWETIKPVVTVGISLLIDWLGKGGTT